MEKSKISKNIKKVHFIGIGGVGMSALALHLKAKGLEVSGSDICLKNAVFLKKQGIIVYNQQKEENVQSVDLVVYTSAIKEDNAELKQAKNSGIALVKRSELLGRILDEHNLSIAISGSHGKTTATDMLANVLIESRLDPSIFLGGFDKTFGNYRYGNGKIALAEACEYERNFLDLKPKISVVLNVDNDHMDTYKDIDDVVNAFGQFIDKSLSVINADDLNSRKLLSNTSITFGIEKMANYTAKNIIKNKNGYSFSAYHGTLKLGRINLSVDGKHNVYNALSVIVVSQTLKIPFIVQKRALEKFSGVKRRNEYLGEYKNLKIYADYAHHPKEISAMLKTFNSQKENFITIFQPHTYSRTALLMQDFLECFSACSPLIIYKTFPAREKYYKKGSAKILYQNLKLDKYKKVYYVKSKKEIENVLLDLCIDYDKAVFLGAGDIYDLAKSITK